MTTCTIGPNAVTGERCGKPAAVTFKGSDGKLYAECLEHAVTFTKPSALTVGSKVRVFHCGIHKVGTVVKVGRSRCEVEVGIGNSLRGGAKVITRPISEVSAL